MKVARPTSPLLAIAVAKAILDAQTAGELTKEQSKIAHGNMLQLQDYKFVGYWKRNTKEIVDANGKVIDTLKEGDSFLGD